MLSFEGNYLNEKKNGKGIYYYTDGKIEGEYLYDYNIKWKKYKEKDQLIFKGEYKYNTIIKWREYAKGRLEYEGEYLYEHKWNGKEYEEKDNVIYELNKDICSIK